MMSRPSTSEKLSVARCGSRPRGWWPCSSEKLSVARCGSWSWIMSMLIGEAGSVASEPLLLQRRCVCRLSLERRRGGHGTGRSVGMVAMLIGEAERGQGRVTASDGGR